jgi:hypothetical protein
MARGKRAGVHYHARRALLRTSCDTALVSTVAPHGPAMAKDLGRLLDRKDSVHYGAAMISAAEGVRMVGWAARLVGHAHAAVEA